MEFHFEEDQLFYTIEGEERKKARDLYARPISHHGGEISIVDAKSKEEVLWVDDLESQPEPLRSTLRAAIAHRYPISRIQRITSSQVNFGYRILEVETDRGPCSMNVTDVWKNVKRLDDGSVMIRDSMGNRFCIPSLEALDPDSLKRAKESL